MMAPNPESLSIEELLRHDAWLRALARRLIGDADADDVVQQTWLKAIENRPKALSSPRRWLSVVTSNFANRAHRTRVRRRGREQVASTHEAVPSTEELIQQLHAQRRVAELVSELPEPLRTTVLLRYFQDQPPRAIADRMGVTETNVRKRLSRAMQRLRRDLDGESDTNPSLRAGFLLLGAPRFGSEASAIVGGASAAESIVVSQAQPMSLLGVFSMSAQIKAGLVGVLLLCVAAGVAYTWNPRGPEAPTQQVAAATNGGERGPLVDPPSETPPSRTSVEAPEVLAVREPIEAPAAGLSVDTAQEYPERRLRGRVTDPHGRPLAGVPLMVLSRMPDTDHPEPLEPSGRTLSDPKGLFDFEHELESGYVVAGETHATLASSRFGERPGQRRELLVIAQTAVSLAGVCVDGVGVPLPGVSVSVGSVDLREYPGVLDRTKARHYVGTASDDAGLFSLKGLPRDSVTLTFEKDGYESHDLSVGSESRSNLTITLVEKDDVPYVVEGRVLDSLGAPVAGAQVGLGFEGWSTVSGELGEYRLVLPRGERPAATDPLFSVAEGFRTIMRPGFGDLLLSDPDRHQSVDPVFDGVPLTISGRVIDAGGKPVADAVLYLWRQPYLLNRRSAEDLTMPEDAPILDIGPGIRIHATTDGQGRFEIGGLRDQSYVLRVNDDKSGARFSTDPILAGSKGVLLRVPADVTRREVTGTVFGLDGRRLPDLEVRVWVTSYRSGTGRYFSHGPRTTTDESGRFRLLDVPRDDISIAVNGEGILPATVPLDPSASGVNMAITVEQQCHFRVELNHADAPVDKFVLLDSSGTPVDIALVDTQGRFTRDWWDLVEGKSQVLVVTERARTLRLMRGDAEVADVPIHPKAGEVTVLRW